MEQEILGHNTIKEENKDDVVLKKEEELRKKEETILVLTKQLQEKRDQLPKEERKDDVALKKEEELRKKEEHISLLTKQLHEKLDKSPTEQTNKEKQLERKEEYLKNLEQELLQKEEEIRAKIQTGSTTEKSDGESSKKVDITHFVKPYVNPFSGIEPTPKNENSFEDWKVEIECLIKSKIYPDYIATQAIRNSLKGQARKVLVTLGPLASSQDIINKLESVFGNVASGESVLQEFYTASQKSDESITMWGLRI